MRVKKGAKVDVSWTEGFWDNYGIRSKWFYVGENPIKDIGNKFIVTNSIGVPFACLDVRVTEKR